MLLCFCVCHRHCEWTTNIIWGSVFGKCQHKIFTNKSINYLHVCSKLKQVEMKMSMILFVRKSERVKTIWKIIRMRWHHGARFWLDFWLYNLIKTCFYAPNTEYWTNLSKLQFWALIRSWNQQRYFDWHFSFFDRGFWY